LSVPGTVALAAVPVAFVTVFLLWPVAMLISKGLINQGQLDLSVFADLASSGRTWRLIGRTVGQATLATVIAAVASIPLAKCLYLRRWPGRSTVKLLVTVPFVLPAVVVGLAFRMVFAADGPLGLLHLDGSFPAVVAALVFFNLGLMVRVVGSFWSKLDPKPEQAARLLGASPARAFYSVTLRQLTPAVAAGAALVFLFSATAFATVLILGGPAYGTVETEIYLQTTQLLDLRTAAALSLVQLVIVAVALWLSGSARRARQRAEPLRPAQARHRPRLGSGDLLAAATTAVATVFILLPLAALLARSLRTSTGLGLGNYARLASQPVPGLEVTPLQTLGRSLAVSALALIVAMSVGGCMAVVLSRRPRHRWLARLQGLADSAFMLPAGISAVTVGFGLFVTLDRGPLDLRTSFWLIPLAQALVALPLVTRVLLPGRRAIDPRQRQAAAVLGASPRRVFAAIDLRVMARPFALASAYALAVSLGEFGATAFLVRPESTTLPIAIYRLMGRPGVDNLGTALAAAVLLGLVACGVVALAELRRPGGQEVAW